MYIFRNAASTRNRLCCAHTRTNTPSALFIIIPDRFQRLSSFFFFFNSVRSKSFALFLFFLTRNPVFITDYFDCFSLFAIRFSYVFRLLQNDCCEKKKKNTPLTHSIRRFFSDVLFPLSAVNVIFTASIAVLRVFYYLIIFLVNISARNRFTE